MVRFLIRYQVYVASIGRVTMERIFDWNRTARRTHDIRWRYISYTLKFCCDSGCRPHESDKAETRSWNCRVFRGFKSCQENWGDELEPRLEDHDFKLMLRTLIGGKAARWVVDNGILEGATWAHIYIYTRRRRRYGIYPRGCSALQSHKSLTT